MTGMVYIDLTLAKTYYPVFVAYCKGIILCFIIWSFEYFNVDKFNAYVISAAVLYVDHCVSTEYIFNTNTLVCIVLFSAVFNENCVAFHDTSKRIAGIILNVLWSTISIASMQNIQNMFSIFQYFSYNAMFMNVLALCIHSFVQHTRDLSPFLLLRMLDFLTLSFFWVYIVHVRKISHARIYNCVECVTYFGHVLFVSITIAAISTTVICIILAVEYRSCVLQLDLGVSECRDSESSMHGDLLVVCESHSERAQHSERARHSEQGPYTFEVSNGVHRTAHGSIVIADMAASEKLSTKGSVTSVKGSATSVKTIPVTADDDEDEVRRMYMQARASSVKCF